MNNVILKKISKQIHASYVIFFFIIILLVAIFISGSLSEVLDNDVEVEPESQLTYYLDVSYDGVDRNGVESDDRVLSEIRSGNMYVEDKIPEGLEFLGFVTTADGSIGAVKRSDSTICAGKVIDDTNEASLTEGQWNNAHTEYTYHGLHYNATTRTVSFTVKNIKAGCMLTVGIITETPTIDDPNTVPVETRRDFYNFATARERDLTVNSNNVHVFMGNENLSLYQVSYQYTGVVPTNAPALPPSNAYAPGASVGVASNVTLDGYTFSGWTTTDATITDNSFVMPNSNVVLTGSFTEVTTKKVTYQVPGTKPSGYVVPSEKNYAPGVMVFVDSLKEGDVINGYKFLGWTSNDVTISEDGDFEMPNSNVLITGSFEEVTYRVTYQFYDTVLPPNADNYLPASQTYHAGDTVTLSNVVSEPNGYKFLGWYKENTFVMPDKDLVIYGEWKVLNGTFEPTITKEVVGNKTHYHTGEVVNFKITVTNTAAFAITNVTVKENTENSKFIAGADYTVLSNHVATIDSIAASDSVELYATYTVLDTDVNSITNEAEIIGATAANNYELYEKDYKAQDSFLIQSKLKVCKEISGTSTEQIFQFLIKGTTNNYETWMALEKDQCETVYIDPGTYKVKEIVPQEYVIKTVSGAVTSDNTNLVVVQGQNYEITYTNEFRKKGFLHSFGRIVNKVTGGG